MTNKTTEPLYSKTQIVKLQVKLPPTGLLPIVKLSVCKLRRTQKEKNKTPYRVLPLTD